MMADSRRVALEGRRKGTSGISIASLLMTPASGCDDRWGLCSDTDLRNWTRLCLERFLSTTPASKPSSLSEVSARRILSGSSSSASCSAMSPVSVQESNSESAESDDGRSWWWSSSTREPANNDVDWAPWCSGRLLRVRRGMLEGRRFWVGGGILEDMGLFGSSSLPRYGNDSKKKRRRVGIEKKESGVFIPHSGQSSQIAAGRVID